MKQRNTGSTHCVRKLVKANTRVHSKTVTKRYHREKSGSKNRVHTIKTKMGDILMEKRISSTGGQNTSELYHDDRSSPPIIKK